MTRPYYKEPVFRPPSEAGSLLIQATEGCTHKCTFCISNYGKKYIIRPVEEVKADLDAAKQMYGPRVQRLFFLDGNALSMPASQLVEITSHARRVFPSLDRVGVYACGEDVLKKSDQELRKLRDAGLGIVYVGLETGDDELLHAINKHITSAELVAAARKVMDAGITFSGTIILGLAGNDASTSRRHATNSARMVNAMCPETTGIPWYIATLTLMVPPHTAIQKAVQEGHFVPLTSFQILEELKIMLENSDDGLHDCVFRSNHASKYLPLRGILADDKARLVSLIASAREDTTRLRPEYMRGL